MVLKAIIDSKIDDSSYIILIPKFEQAGYNNKFTASACSSLSGTAEYTIGTSVYVMFENSDMLKPIIIGSTSPDGALNALNINTGNIHNKIILPFNTTINDVNMTEINTLNGLRDNISSQFSIINENFLNIESSLKLTNDLLLKNNNKLEEYNKSILSTNNKIDLRNKEIGKFYDVNEDNLFSKINTLDTQINDTNSLIGESTISIVDLLDNLYEKFKEVEQKSSSILSGTASDNYGDATSDSRTSNRCIDFIKSCEGFSKYAFWDYAQFSIGYGSRCDPGDYPNGITVEEATILLKNFVVETFEPAVIAFEQKRGIPFNQHQFDALVSLSYNLGANWTVNHGSLYDLFIRPDSGISEGAVKSTLSVYVHAGGKVLPGLVKRREAEANMFLYGIYSWEGVNF